ncbi:PRTRC system protein E [Deinococcus gobiensis]|uniref:PEGA domain-containing protein n=1 Tax=Deinococcus gobiensis (strain DSM 21396 / JCM 16679 / CGMCC 1.7299 / I-0) TaxID=745776 RepID=H8H2R1_DEIGI|nr:PRTRC system protein E [Deinococcus gobiensis]AFD27808.1 hypothetical protein DGo_PC0016 [Deinococcus gobiensis I-0]
MTNTATPLDDLFAVRSLAVVHNDLMRVMADLRAQDSPHREEARNLFKENQKAKTDVDAAEALLQQIRNLGQPAPTNLTLPAQDPQAVAPSADRVEVEPTPPVQQSAPVEPLQDLPDTPVPDPLPSEPAVEDEASLDEPSDIPEEAQQEDADAAEAGAEDTPDEDPGEDEPAQPEAAQAPTPPLPAATIEWPDGTLGEGLFSQLAATLGPGESLGLVLARSKGKAQLLVTVQPVPLTGEPDATAVPLQINGTPATLDTELVGHMTAFRAARAVARETTDYLAQIKAASEQAKKAADDARKKASKPATSATPAAAKRPASDGSLKLEVAPADAMIVLTDSAGKTHPVKHGKDAQLPVGEYTVIVEADGYARHEEKITIRSNYQTKKGVVLLKASADRLL